MAEARVERRLVAILAADIAGYSRLMGKDEEGTLAALKACHREVIDPKVAEHRGRIVNTPGDSVLIEFASAVDAAHCAVEIQKEIAERNSGIPEDRRVEFRIGINVGDVIIDEGDIYGDGVNIAARVEALASPGAICLSDNAYQQIKGKLTLDVSDMGEQRLKNIAQPVRVYGVRLNGAPERPALVLPDKPSIAVLPFQNISGDPEQEYFADGMVEEIITGLSRLRWLFVIARNSSFTYKGRSVDVKQVGRELGVQFVLEGSVRKAGNRVRITGQLIDATTGAHLWADRFDGSLEDVFDLQDQVTASVVSAITPKMEQAEIERAKRKPTESLDAYDYYLRGMASAYHWTKEGVSDALRLFYKAIEIDSEFASAYGAAAWGYYWRIVNGWTADRTAEVAEVVRLSRGVAEFGKDDAVALSFGGLALGRVAGKVEAGIEMIDRALVLNPNLAGAWNASGFLRTFLGNYDLAIEHLAHAMRLNPLDHLLFHTQAVIALAHFLAGRDDVAWPLAERACREQPNLVSALRLAAATNACAGRLGEAREFIARALEFDPDQRVSNLKDRVGPFRPQDFAKYVNGLRLAGLPE